MEKPRRRSSFFGFSSPRTSSKSEESVYADQLQQENKKWGQYLVETNQQFKKYWRDVKEQNEKDTVMSKERIEFLDRKVDMPSFINETAEIIRQLEFHVRRKQWFFKKYDMLIDELHDKEIKNRSKQQKLVKLKKKRKILNIR